MRDARARDTGELENWGHVRLTCVHPYCGSGTVPYPLGPVTRDLRTLTIASSNYIVATRQAMKRLASLSQGRVALLDDTRDVNVSVLEPLMAIFSKHNNNGMCVMGIGQSIRRIACTKDAKTPQRDILEVLLCAIDRLLDGNGSPEDLKNGASRLYDDTHLQPMHAESGLKTLYMSGYPYMDIGSYGKAGARAHIRVAMHRVMCWLRWHNPSKDSKASVCHDPHCPRRDCVSLGCLRWGDDADNGRDRVIKSAHRRARQGRASPSVAQASECSHGCPKHCG